MEIRKKSELTLAMHRQKERDKTDANIRAGLQELKDNPTIKRTLKELAKLSGITTQTLRRREWPLEAINELKAKKRREKKLDELERKERLAKQKKGQKDLIQELAAEVGYWFKEQTKLKVELESTTAAMKRYKDSQNLHIEAFEQLEAKHKKLIDYLNDFHGIDAKKI